MVLERPHGVIFSSDRPNEWENVSDNCWNTKALIQRPSVRNRPAKGLTRSGNCSLPLYLISDKEQPPVSLTEEKNPWLRVGGGWGKKVGVLFAPHAVYEIPNHGREMYCCGSQPPCEMDWASWAKPSMADLTIQAGYFSQVKWSRRFRFEDNNVAKIVPRTFITVIV